MSVSVKGFNQNAVTLVAVEGLKAGDLVKISANHTAAACASGNIPVGVCLSNDGKYACVQLTGWANVKYSSTAPALGSAVIAADGAGGIKTATTGRNVTVIAVNTADTTAEIIF